MSSTVRLLIAPARGLARLRRDRQGVAALEFIVIANILILLMLGAFDIGNAVQEQIALEEAVHAGGLYAQSFPTDQTGIQNAVTGTMPSASASIVCSCSGVTGTFSCSSRPGTCAPPVLTTITATGSITTFAWTGIPAFSPSATYVVRTQ